MSALPVIKPIMLSEINNSKEVIKNRMLKHALTYWGIKNTEDLDPVVKLILEALSSELHNIGSEIEETRTSILAKIAGLLAPDFLTAPVPAHAIAFAFPIEPVDILANTTAFYGQSKISSKQHLKEPDITLDIFFTPVDTVKLFDARVSYVGSRANLYHYDPAFKRQLITKSAESFRENNTLWIGLKTNPDIQDLQGLAFYFDWKNLEASVLQHIYQLLPLAKWFVDDRELETEPGIRYEPPVNNDNYDDFLLDHDLLSLMERDVKSYYEYKFISIKSRQSLKIEDIKQYYPSAFNDLFPGNDLLKLKEKLLWIRIVFPAGMKQQLLDEVFIYSNAFPVMNRKVNDLKYRLKGGSHIIPLKTASFDQFLSVRTLSDEKQPYKAIPYRGTDKEETGTYTLHSGGAERLDNRNAREMINYLLELLRSESAAFAAYGQDFITNTLKEMNQKISVMEDKTRGYIDDAAELPNYIMVNPYEGHDIMYVAFWTTLAEIANGIRAGTFLQQLNGTKVKQETITLVTGTIGGKNKMQPAERLHAFRYGIMTRNRIITKEDIRYFCFYELGDKISKVDVQKGTEMSANSKAAFCRTIDVILTLSENQATEILDWQVLCDQLKSKLLTRSGIGSNYRIVIKA